VDNQKSSGNGAATAPAFTTDALQTLLQAGVGPEPICKEVAGIFHVRLTEIALLHLDNKVLRFLFPQELKAMGMIPLSSPSIAAHTALSGEPETFNNFAEVKHASVFETVKLGSSAEKQAIQKMMSAPVLDENHNVLGVLQISRKGSDTSSSGPDFTAGDIRLVQAAAKVLSKASFLQPASKK
jgi:hypothetical protein